MAEFDHATLPGASLHVSYRWSYADETARLAAAGFTLDDVGHFALQEDESSLWLLTDDSPITWARVSGGTSAVTSVNGSSGDVTLDADDIDDTSTTNKFTTAAEITKLAGIETGADVTDATNVDAAGATMNADTSLAGNGYFLDEDDFVSNSATKVPSQQSTKAYVDSAIAGGGYTDEMAQDAVGTILDDSGDIDFTYDDATPKITGAVKSDAITYAKMQNVSATDKLLGRSSSGSGDVEEIACTAAGRAILDDANATAQKATLGLDAVTIGVTFILGDGTNVITSSEPPQIINLPVAITWTKWMLEADASGSITIEVDRAANGTPTTFSSIAGTEKPALSSAQTNSDASPFGGGGDTTTDADDRLKIYVSGTPSTVKRVYFHLVGTRAM